MASNVQLPLKNARIILLSLTWAAAVIGGCVGINAIVKRNIQVAHVKNSGAAEGVTINVDTRSLVDPGILLATGCTVTSIIASSWLGLIYLDLKRKTTVSTRTLPLQWASFAFMSIWVLACAIPVTWIALTGSATVTAFLGGMQLPDAVVVAQARSIGVDPAYWSNGFVHLQVIPPWFALGFAIPTAIVSFLAARKASTTSQYPHSRVVDSARADSPIEKSVDAHKEDI